VIVEVGVHESRRHRLAISGWDRSVIDEILRVDLDAPRKQRHTAKRIFDRLLDEHGMRVVSYSVVRSYVAARRPQIYIEASPSAAGPRFSTPLRRDRGPAHLRRQHHRDRH
jgi:hypothetical protein